MKLSAFMIFPLLWCFECCLAKPVEQGSVTEAVVDVTPYPDAQKRYIDINNVSPEVTNILRENNMSLDRIRTMHAKLQNKTNRELYYLIPSSTYPAPTASKDFDEEIRLLSIRNSLAKTLRESDDSDVQSNAEFDYTIAAVCEIPRHINLSEWFGQKSWNIFFRPNYRQYNIKSIFLRLFKVAVASGKASKECDPDVGDFYKLTVSVYSRKRKELKKKIIYAQMVASNFNGWIEIDALSTLKFWDQGKNNLGMAIDVYDQDDNQLDAKEHFHLQNCEAGPQIPWRAFKLISESHRGSVSEDDVEIYRNMHTGPRLDLTSSVPAKYHISSTEQQHSETEEKSTRHLRHTHHHRLQRSSEEATDSSSKSQSHQTNVEHRDRSHRGDNQVEET